MEIRTCQNCKKEFTVAPEDFEFYDKVKVPPPTWCPLCRFMRRASWRNERKLYRVKSAKSGKDLLSLFSPADGLTIYDEGEWYADDWDAADYGRDYDFGKTFFEQFYDLMKTVPLPSRSGVVSMVNSDYSANASYLKNCYLMFNSNYDEDCAYGNAVDHSRDCFDNSHINKCERSYGSFWLNNCYQAHFCCQCVDSQSLWFCRDCQGCTNCFGCANLRNKSYCIYNKQYSKEEYFSALGRFRLDTWRGVKDAEENTHNLWMSVPWKSSQGIKNVDSTGSYVTHSKNVKNGFLVREGEDLKYCQYLQVPPNKDCYDHTVWGDGNSCTIECVVCGEGTYEVKYCCTVYAQVKNIEYSAYCISGSSNLFGCVGLRKKEYCILNKQYSKEEYFILRERIIKQMNEIPYRDRSGIEYKYGEFFPPEFSFHAYNATIAQEFFPLTKEQAETKGYRWNDSDTKEFQTTLDSSNLPEAIGDVPETILKEIIKCAECGRAYRVINSELNFLRAENIPLPRTCVDCRHNKRISQRLKTALYDRTCAKCGTDVTTGYAPDRPEIIYCEKCYQAEVA